MERRTRSACPAVHGISQHSKETTPFNPNTQPNHQHPVDRHGDGPSVRIGRTGNPWPFRAERRGVARTADGDRRPWIGASRSSSTIGLGTLLDLQRPQARESLHTLAYSGRSFLSHQRDADRRQCPRRSLLPRSDRYAAYGGLLHAPRAESRAVVKSTRPLPGTEQKSRRFATRRWSLFTRARREAQRRAYSRRSSRDLLHGPLFVRSSSEARLGLQRNGSLAGAAS